MVVMVRLGEFSGPEDVVFVELDTVAWGGGGASVVMMGRRAEEAVSDGRFPRTESAGTVEVHLGSPASESEKCG